MCSPCCRVCVPPCRSMTSSLHHHTTPNGAFSRCTRAPDRKGTNVAHQLHMTCTRQTGEPNSTYQAHLTAQCKAQHMCTAPQHTHLEQLQRCQLLLCRHAPHVRAGICECSPATACGERVAKELSHLHHVWHHAIRNVRMLLHLYACVKMLQACGYMHVTYACA